MKKICKILIILLLTYNLNAMNCSDYKNFQLFNGHYYSVSIDKLTFESAKQIAVNNGGTLAIPNSTAENEFIKSLIGGGNLGWIGIHDPNKIQNFCYGGSCAYDDTRFKSVKNESLSFKNFDSFQPDNLVKSYDIVDNKSMVSPIGEFWVVMSGNNGKWHDMGNHADSYNNPVKYKAVFEFDNLNECTPPSDDDELDLSGRFCNTKVWDETVDTVLMGKTVDCALDSFGNEYCPEALAKAGEYWDINDGFSKESIGFTVDYTSKVYMNSTEIVYSYTSCSGTANGLLMTGSPNTKCSIPSIGLCAWGSWGNQCEMPNLGSYIAVGDCTRSTAHGVKLCNNSQKTGKVVNVNIKKCPGGYSETTGAETSKGECKKDISYTYYEYLCKDESNQFNENYTPVVSDTNIPKIDTDTTNINENTLNDTVGSPTPPTNNCKRQGFTCNSNLRTPAFINNEWQCSPFPCLGESNLEKLDTEVGKSDKNNDGWNDDGSCDGEMYIFNGKSAKCRSWDMFFGLTGGGCCDKDKVAAGLVACKEGEKMLAAKRKAKKTHYIGNFCSKELKLGFTKICIQKSDGYCTFNSTLGRIIQEQGRVQLNISWGSPDNPKCRGFTADEFQKIDFSKIDLTEFVKDIQSTVQANVVENLGTYVKDKVQNFYEN